MAEAARIAQTINRPTWVMARTQTAARGRQGRRWEVPHGNLSATLIYHPGCTPQVAAQRSFMAAVAVFEALAMYVDRTALSLKWPNDVLLAEGKVAGILLEASGKGPFVDWLSIGIGVNVARTPESVKGAAFAPVALAEHAAETPAPEELLAYIAGAFATQERKLDTFGFTRIREDWLRHAARLGEVITARTAHATHTGRFETVDAHGNLVLQTAEGTTTIPAADVYF